MELGRGRFRVRVCPVLRDGDGVCGDLEEDGRVVVQGGRWCGAGGRVRLGVVQHGPCRGLGKSGEPGVLQRARGGGRWAWLARLEARGLARTLLAMAATLALIAVMLPSGAPPSLPRTLPILTAAF